MLIYVLAGPLSTQVLANVEDSLSAFGPAFMLETWKKTCNPSSILAQLLGIVAICCVKQSIEELFFYLSFSPFISSSL